MVIRTALMIGLIFVVCPPSRAATVTIRQIVETLAKATLDHPADFSGLDMSDLDLSGIAFKGAHLAGVNLFGSDLRGADLSHTDLRHANLTRVQITATNFAHADMSGVRLFLPGTFSTPTPIPAEAPNFEGAVLSGAHILAKLCWANLAGTDLRGARFDGDGDTMIGPSRSDLTGAKLMHANLAHAHLAALDLEMSDLSHADLTDADLSDADLTGADFTGAAVTGMKLTRARGLDRAKGMP
jgi:uncharacterized protein YjbI with pentapeptide repeats